MSQSERLARLLKEFERVGVDPNTISAGLAVSEDDGESELHQAALARWRTWSALTSQTEVGCSGSSSRRGG